jgi:hypothetical protein
MTASTPSRSDMPPLSDDAPVASSRRLSLILAVAAGLCWAAALLLMMMGDIGTQADPLSPARLFFCLIVVAAGVLTFVPVERQLGLGGLTVEGSGGVLLLFYTLAFVPAPTGWLLSPPDAPVYALLAFAVFLSVAAVALPLVFVAGRRLFRQRARQYDQRRARRQAREIGAFAALLVGMAGLRVFTPLGVALLILILITVELLFLSVVDTEG